MVNMLCLVKGVWPQIPETTAAADDLARALSLSPSLSPHTHTGMAPDHLQEKLSTLCDDITKLQAGMVSDDETTKTGAEKKLKELIAQCSGEATRQHQSEDEIAADLERIKLELEKKREEELQEWKAAEAKRTAEENKDVSELSEVAQREVAAAEHAIKMAAQKKIDDAEAKKAAAVAAEEEKKRQLKKFLDEKAKAELKHKQAKKKK